MTLELTTRFRGISTSPKSGAKRNSGHSSPSKAVGHAMANLRYITRDSALADVAWFGKSALDAIEEVGPSATPSQQRKALTKQLREALEKRAAGGGQDGRMVATRVIVSLPNDWPDSAKDEALLRLGHYFAPPDSEALAVGALHRDKDNNSHLHFLVADGRESEHAALNRRAQEMRKGEPAPKRIRRRNVNRFNAELGRPKVIRAEIATILNKIADRDSLERVEWRSFEARGIAKTPTTHRGPEKEARMDKEHEAKMVEAANRPRTGSEWYDGGECESIARPRTQTPEKVREAAPSANPPKPATVQPEQPPAGRRAFVRGRWITLPNQDSPKPKKKKRARDEDER